MYKSDIQFSATISKIKLGLFDTFLHKMKESDRKKELLCSTN